jgi:hypothetical protein
MAVDYETPSSTQPEDMSHMRRERVESIMLAIKAREPDLLDRIPEDKTDEFVLTDLIAKAKDLELKKSLLTTFVEGEVEEGDYFGAVFALAVSRASELHIEKFDENFVQEQFNKARSSGQLRQAWGITLLMESDGIKSAVVSESRKDWNIRENDIFARLNDKKEVNLEEVLNHIAGNLNNFGDILSTALIESKRISRPWEIETGEAVDASINKLIEKLGYKTTRENDNRRVLSRIETSARTPQK